MDISLLEAGKAALMGLVEGVTEFLPISSTGHLIVVGDWINFAGDTGTGAALDSARVAFASTFEIFIQLGSILSVVWIYRKKVFDFSQGWVKFWTKIFVSFLPAAIVGLALHSFIKAHLFTVPVVATSLIVGGVAILMIEGLVKKMGTGTGNGDRSLSTLRFDTALWIGMSQILALVPGVSRSGATIMGGILTKLDRKTATEYSFFLAIPTMLAATAYDVFKSRGSIHGGSDVLILAIGFVVAFVSALVAVKVFLKFVSTHSFKGFAWYRIGFGLLLFLLLKVR